MSADEGSGYQSEGRGEPCNHDVYVDFTIKFLSTFMEENIGGKAGEYVHVRKHYIT